jgi:hypothetical protein
MITASRGVRCEASRGGGAGVCGRSLSTPQWSSGWVPGNGDRSASPPGARLPGQGITELWQPAHSALGMVRTRSSGDAPQGRLVRRDLASGGRAVRLTATSRPATPNRVDGRHRAASINGITSSDGEGQGERAPTRCSGAGPCRLAWLPGARRSGLMGAAGWDARHCAAGGPSGRLPRGRRSCGQRCH